MTNYDIDTFGGLLHDFRKRAHLTQQQLAEALGMHRHAVSRWEQGEVLPASKAVVLEIARCLHLDDAETRLFLEASLTAPAPLWGVPLPRNLLFAGRAEVLETLHTHLSLEPGGTAPHAVALHGLAGVGKTQTALEYAYHHALEYTATFWINAETEESMLASFATLARLLKLPVQVILKQEDVVALVLNWLSSHRDWLLIFDNVENRELIARFVPSSYTGSLLFTTRFPTLGPLASSLELHPLSLEESLRLLLRRTENHLLVPPSAQLDAEEAQAARAIAVALDGLPLALDQAAAYIEEAQCRFGDFLALFQHDALQVLQEHAASVAYPRSVEKTFTMAFERLRQQTPAAADLLTVCCFLAPDEIPEELLVRGRYYFPRNLQEVLADPFQLNTALKDLLAYALLRRNARSRTISIHRLLQTVFQQRLPAEIQQRWVTRLIRMLESLFHLEQDWLDTEHWPWCEHLLPHVQKVFHLADQMHLASPELGALLCKTATYLFQRARYDQAEHFYLRALLLQEQTRGKDHPDLIPTLVGIARTHTDQGKHEDVEELYQRALSLCDMHLEAEDLQRANPCSGLAFFYAYVANQPAKAITLYQQALHIRTTHLAAPHPAIATTLNDLAVFYYHQGDDTQAESLCVQALHMREQVRDPHHPDIAESLDVLGVLCMRQANYQEAEALLIRSLTLREQTLGPDHVYVAAGLNNLARLYQKQTRYALAELVYQRGLAIGTRILGPDDPFVALLLSHLAVLYCHLGKYEEAEAAATRALSLCQGSFPSDHIRLSGSLQSLALLAYKQGKYLQADALFPRILALREKHLQSDHPDLAETLHLRANTCRALGKYMEAESLYQRVMQIYEKALGAENIQGAILKGDWAMLYRCEHQWQEAEMLYQEALRLWEPYQELDHPEYADCLETYALLIEQQGKKPGADRYHAQARAIRARREAAAHAAPQTFQAICEQRAHSM